MAKKKPAPPAALPAVDPKPCTTSIYCYPKVLPSEFVERVRRLEKALGCEVWLMIQLGSRPGAYQRMDFPLFHSLIRNKGKLPKPVLDNGVLKSRMAVLIHSGGGKAEPAYRIARLLQRQCAGFTAVIPAFAKSAATLLSLGANSIVLGDDAEMGPLDAQIYDADTEEEMVSALDEIQAVESLEQSAIDSAWRMLLYLHERTGKKFNTLLPLALHFAAEVTKPLFDKIDSVRYSRQSRRLQEAQDYAERLLQPRFSEEAAKAIARDLVRNYPTHAFVIDREETTGIGKMDDGRRPVGLPLHKMTTELKELMDWFYLSLADITAIGKLETIEPK